MIGRSMALTSPALPAPTPDEHVETEHRVTPLELFFDLVFVFAITQITGLMAAHPTWRGLLHGLLVLVVLWQAWVAYAWLTNSIDPDAGVARVTVLAAMAAMLVVSLAVPEAFGDNALLFAIAYLLVRVLHVVLYLAQARDAGVHAAIARLSRTLFIGPAILIAAALAGGALRDALWAVAVLLDVGGVFLSGLEGWTVAPGHFAERHGLVIIIALGESIVAIGAGTGHLDAGVVAAAIVGLVVVFALWWAYFDVVAVVAERRLRRATGVERARLARDSYSYLHLPMVGGIVLLALGVKTTLHAVEDPLKPVAAVALCGGVALYLLGHIAFRLRNVHSLNRQRLFVAAVCLALIVPARSVPALLTMTILAVLLAGLILYEAIHFAEARARIRTQVG
jgi:low temperature requirement protein LtrA